MRKWILCLSIVLLYGVNAVAQEAVPYCDGEKVSLSIMYKWGAVNTEVGLATLEVDSLHFKGEEAYHLNCKAKTAPFFDLFYKIREDLQSWVRVQDQRPLQFTRNTLEGSYTATNLYDFDWEKQVIHADINFGNRGPQHLEVPLKEGDCDLISLVYKMRNLGEAGYKKGAKTVIHFAIDDDVYDVTVTFRGEETIKVRKMGKMKALHLSCSVVQGELFAGDELMHLWLSADENRIPVAAFVPLKVGNVQAWLTGYSGLKHEFSAWTDGRNR